jgi:hypothetical protein
MRLQDLGLLSTDGKGRLIDRVGIVQQIGIALVRYTPVFCSGCDWSPVRDAYTKIICICFKFLLPLVTV